MWWWLLKLADLFSFFFPSNSEFLIKLFANKSEWLILVPSATGKQKPQIVNFFLWSCFKNSFIFHADLIWLSSDCSVANILMTDEVEAFQDVCRVIHLFWVMLFFWGPAFGPSCSLRLLECTATRQPAGVSRSWDSVAKLCHAWNMSQRFALAKH